jgi:UDP-N-acetylglucosamine--dolichyl-phosphate N-acetylglucosaminephosphotransferase
MTFSCNEQVYKQHLVSFSLILPFMLNTLALIKFNRYPSKVFVGDTYCYFAGMTFAVAGILGHYSKTMLLFFIPQILNFLISLPQLFGIFHCPRHRLPRYNSKDDVLESVPEHHTLINLVLWLVGPTHERDLVTLLTGLQVLSCGFAFYVRYHVSTLFY